MKHHVPIPFRTITLLSGALLCAAVSACAQIKMPIDAAATQMVTLNRDYWTFGKVGNWQVYRAPNAGEITTRVVPDGLIVTVAPRDKEVVVPVYNLAARSKLQFANPQSLRVSAELLGGAASLGALVKTSDPSMTEIGQGADRRLRAQPLQSGANVVTWNLPADLQGAQRDLTPTVQFWHHELVVPASTEPVEVKLMQFSGVERDTPARALAVTPMLGDGLGIVAPGAKDKAGLRLQNVAGVPLRAQVEATLRSFDGSVTRAADVVAIPAGGASDWNLTPATLGKSGIKYMDYRVKIGDVEKTRFGLVCLHGADG